MRSSSDPSIHRLREQQFIQHVERLLTDDRLRIDTTLGRRPVTTLVRDVSKGDRSVDLQRLMSEMNKPDRELKSKMPVGESIEVSLSRQRLMFFKNRVGRLRIECVSPTRALLAGEEAKPMAPADVTKALAGMPPPLGGVPSTVVLLSTSGFTLEAHELAERRAERTVILAEPNDAGGWSVYGPVETKVLTDLFDPEAEEEKRRRIREEVENSRAELLAGGVPTDRIATRTQLPITLIESELKSYAKENAGLVAKRLDGKVVLFREGSAPAAAGGGSDMPFIDRVKALFSRKGETEKKIAFLSERRAALSQQRDRGYEDMSTLEGQEADLRKQFKEAGGEISKRRITSQLLQLRKDIDRRQQLLSVLNQQINVVSTHLHNLELVQQGHTAKLPDTEEMAQDAAAAEDVLAQLEADTELAGSVGSIASSGMSAEEQALYEELLRENGQSPTDEKTESAEPAKEAPLPPIPNRERTTPPTQQTTAAPAQRQPRGEAEPG